MKKRISKIITLTAGFFILMGITACNMDVDVIHEHTYSDKWTVDGDYHWHAATCEHSEEISGKEAHTWNEGEVTTAPTETAEGEKTYKCTVCEKTKVETVAKLSHKHAYKEEWASDATQHWHDCPGCKEKGSAANHEWEGDKCKVCGYEKEKTEDEKTEDDKKKDEDVKNDEETKGGDVNPTISSLASISQDFIFNTNSVGTTTVTIRRSEWNKMLEYYDYFYKNENNVIAESYEYKKDGKIWKLNTVGLRLRGNTSRYRPQGYDDPNDGTGHRQQNGDWNKDYYNRYKKSSPSDSQYNNVYRQSHFKVDFEPLSGDDRKLSDCMKGVALKRSDSVFSKEIFCYNLFHQYGIWTAPRASQTKVYINIVEDIDSDGNVISGIGNCSKTLIDYGVYEMFEEVNKQSLKGRMKKKGNNSASTSWANTFASITTNVSSDKLNENNLIGESENKYATTTIAWENNDGDLWKCSGGNLTTTSNIAANFGCEQVEILNTDKPKDQWTHVWTSDPKNEHNTTGKSICYDLKTNKKSVDRATSYFQGFITELNNLSGYDKDTQTGIDKRKEFYEKWFDVNFFIRTYAINILVGMDDDYWGNQNNYYLYFDNGAGGSNKCYFIPFDYDNTLGSSITGDKACTDPMKWGNGHDRPLLDRLIEVPEYKLALQNALLEVSDQTPNSPWEKENSYKVWDKWHDQLGSYVYSADMKTWPDISQTNISDDGSWKQDNTQKHYLTRSGDSENLYEQMYANIRYWFNNTASTITINLNGATHLVNDNEEKTPVGNQTIVKIYSGDTLKFTKMAGGTPYRDGYRFKGWTLTDSPTDNTYIDTYATSYGSITIYAKWRSLTEDTIIKDFPTNTGTNTVTVHIKATNNGLEFEKSNSEIFNHVNIQFTDLTDNKSLIYIDNLDENGSNVHRITDTITYPFVEANHMYKLKFEFMDNSYGNYHSLEIQVKAVGGAGNMYINIDGYTYDKENKTLTFINLDKKLFNPYSNNPDNYIAYMFSRKLWGDHDNLPNQQCDGDCKWDNKWKFINQNQIKFYTIKWDNGTAEYDEEATWFDDKSKHIVCISFEFKIGDINFRKALIEGQIWSQ